MESALDLWKKKLKFLQRQEPVTVDFTQKFQLEQLIAECLRNIELLDLEEGKSSEELEPTLNSEFGLRKILFLSANPKNNLNRRLDEERREIKEGLQRSRKRDYFHLKSAGAIRYRDIYREIIDYEPNIVHFSGYGSDLKGLLIEDDMGKEKTIDAKALAELFKLLVGQIDIECVVLNACYSVIQAKAISQSIDHVIGVSQSIQHSSAIDFAVGFYDALGAGQSYEFAHRLGCISIQMARISEDLQPQLLGKSHNKNFADWSTDALSSTQVKDVRANNKDALLIPGRYQKPSKAPLASLPTSLAPIGVKIVDSNLGLTVLRSYLEQGELQKADQKTLAILLKLADREDSGWLRKKDIEALSEGNLLCSVLHEIDKHWVKHSKGKFGLSVQNLIWKRFGSDKVRGRAFSKFCSEVGWSEHIGDEGYESFDFALTARKAHLPSLKSVDNRNKNMSQQSWRMLLESCWSCMSN